MRRIFTSAIAIICAISASAQCNFSTTAPAGATGAQNTFTTGAEGFTGNVTYANNGGAGGRLETTSGTGVRTITTPVYFYNPGTSTLIARFTLERLTGSSNISAYSVTATTAGGTVALCPTTAISPVSPSTPTVYYISIPTTGLSYGQNFQLNISLTQAGQFNFDNFGLNASATNATLPVNFTGINARLVNGSVNLNWTVDAEEHVLGYEVEKSNDGRSFSKVGFVAATKQMQYSFVDASFSGTAYYRIKSVDVDGKFKYTTVVSMKGGKSGVVIKAFPTITRGAITVQHDAAVKGSSISIASQEGRIVKSVLPANGALQTNVDLSSLQAGIYLVRFSDGQGNVETLKVVKQ